MAYGIDGTYSLRIFNKHIVIAILSLKDCRRMNRVEMHCNDTRRTVRHETALLYDVNIWTKGTVPISLQKSS